MSSALSIRLDEDFLFLFGFAKKFMKSAEKPKRVEKWLDKLCYMNTEGIYAKNNRNTYLNKRGNYEEII